MSSTGTRTERGDSNPRTGMYRSPVSRRARDRGAWCAICRAFQIDVLTVGSRWGSRSARPGPAARSTSGGEAAVVSLVAARIGECRRSLSGCPWQSQSRPRRWPTSTPIRRRLLEKPTAGRPFLEQARPPASIPCDRATTSLNPLAFVRRPHAKAGARVERPTCLLDGPGVDPSKQSPCCAVVSSGDRMALLRASRDLQPEHEPSLLEATSTTSRYTPVGAA